MSSTVNAFGSVDGRRASGVNAFGANEVDISSQISALCRLHLSSARRVNVRRLGSRSGRRFGVHRLRTVEITWPTGRTRWLGALVKRLCAAVNRFGSFHPLLVSPVVTSGTTCRENKTCQQLVSFFFKTLPTRKLTGWDWIGWTTWTNCRTVLIVMLGAGTLVISYSRFDVVVVVLVAVNAWRIWRNTHQKNVKIEKKRKI